MSKTIKQIADEIGVSKQAVYKRFRGKLYKDCYPDSYMENGVLYINEVGERKLKEDFKNGIKKTPLYPPAYRAHTECSNGALVKTDDNTSENMIIKPKNEEAIKNNENGVLQWSAYGAHTECSNGALVEKQVKDSEKCDDSERPDKIEDIIAILQSTISVLEKQLEEKDKQIENQGTTIEKLTDSLLLSQQTAAAAQALHAGTLKQKLISNESEENKQGHDNLKAEADSPKHVALFDRIFKRK